MTTVLMLKLFTKQICRCMKTIKIVFPTKGMIQVTIAGIFNAIYTWSLMLNHRKSSFFCCCNYRKYIAFFKYRIEDFNNTPCHNFF